MPRILDQAGNSSRKATARGRTKKSAPSLPLDLLERWQNLAGEEFEQTGSYSFEERCLAETFAHNYGDIDQDI